MRKRILVVDANILIRAVLGTRVRRIFEEQSDQFDFCIPAEALDEARRYVPALIRRNGGDPAAGLRLLEAIAALGTLLERELYEGKIGVATKRLQGRDPQDAHVLAAALTLDCPIWTQDSDFFGCGVATWTTRTISMFLSSED